MCFSPGISFKIQVSITMIQFLTPPSAKGHHTKCLQLDLHRIQSQEVSFGALRIFVLIILCRCAIIINLLLDSRCSSTWTCLRTLGKKKKKTIAGLFTGAKARTKSPEVCKTRKKPKAGYAILLKISKHL